MFARTLVDEQGNAEDDDEEDNHKKIEKKSEKKTERNIGIIRQNSLATSLMIRNEDGDDEEQI